MWVVLTAMSFIRLVDPVRCDRKCGEVYELFLGDQDKGLTARWR